MLTDLIDQHEIVLKRQTAGNPYYGDTTADPVTIHGRWRSVDRLVMDDEGREVIPSGGFSTTEDVAVGDRVTDPDGVERRVIQVAIRRDVEGDVHHRVAIVL